MKNQCYAHHQLQISLDMHVKVFKSEGQSYKGIQVLIQASTVLNLGFQRPQFKLL